MAVLLACAALVSTLLGGIVALRARDRLHLVLGLAAGVLLGVAAFDLLPEALRQTTPGAVRRAGADARRDRRVLHRAHRRALAGDPPRPRGEHGGVQHGPPRTDLQSVGLLAGSGLVLHSMLDGVGIGLGYQAGAKVGLAVAIAVIAHDFADGFNTFTITRCTATRGGGR